MRGEPERRRRGRSQAVRRKHRNDDEREWERRHPTASRARASAATPRSADTRQPFTVAAAPGLACDDLVTASAPDPGEDRSPSS
jgi:hypothetical protein